jgi:hypothetical protein
MYCNSIRGGLAAGAGPDGVLSFGSGLIIIHGTK